MTEFFEMLMSMPLSYYLLWALLAVVYMIACAPIVIGIIGNRRQRAERDKPARRAIYEDGKFVDLDADNTLIKLNYKPDECLVTVDLPWAAPLHVLVNFRTTDNPDKTGKDCPSNINSAPQDQWATKSNGAYSIHVFPGVRLSRVVMHLSKDGRSDQLELVFDQGWESRILLPLPRRPLSY